MKPVFRMSWLLLAVLQGAGCESKAAASSSSTVSGPMPATVGGEGQSVALLWAVMTESEEYWYKFGEGSVTGGRYAIALRGDPPAEAINFFGLGIGFVVSVPGVRLPDGKIATDAVPIDSTVGISTRNSVIWRAKSLDFSETGPPPEDRWPLDFPQGYACGACRPAPDGGSFDAYAPTSCDEIPVNAYDEASMCNWT